ncbi:hypothetical protein ASG43_07915 [Aureimonas sp. Leaf454]|uniref:tyrosine-type recombinase/integrase n=1 Tax=Aureimonas sp. Leaf454 TaxID=1736381 RepID=UPI0006FDDE4D|nr:site-specific integrase [Aureimonas sp. Leaf454]KQT48772.1 hypothetical protein ASG43_07915 [Aureimonas sp. Leaf454]
MATITKRAWKTSKGEVREAWVLAFTDRQGKRHKEQFAKKREADAKRIEVEGLIKGGAYRDSKNTVAEAIEAYVDHLRERNAKGHRVATGYLRNTKAQLDTYVLPRLGDVQLTDLTKGDVAHLRDVLQKQGVSVLTVRKILASLSRTLKHAAEKNWIATNPASGIRVTGGQDDDDGKVVPPSRESLAAIIEAASPDVALRIRFASATGLRASEQWALRWGDVDFKRKEVRVGRTVDIYGIVKDTTKSKAGRRAVPLSDALAAALKAHRGDAVDDAYVFPSTTGGFTRHTNFIKRTWNPAMDAAGVDRLGWHALRHFAISTWVLGGINMKAVQTLAGHASFQMTADRYSHLLPEDAPHAAINRIAEGLPSGA